MSETKRDIYWRPLHEVSPHMVHRPEPDFVCFDGRRIIGRVYQVPQGHWHEGKWLWTMTANAPPGATPFATTGHETGRGDAGRRMVETYERWDAWRLKPSYWDDLALVHKGPPAGPSEADTSGVA